MNVISKSLLSLLLVCIIFAAVQKSCYGMDSVRQDQQQVQKRLDEVTSRPEGIYSSPQKILENTFKPDRMAVERLSPSIRIIRDKTNQLLAREEIRPEEIAALRTDLDEVAANVSSESERVELEKMSERLDFAQSIAKLQQEKQELREIAKESQRNFDKLGEQEEEAKLWKKIFSSSFTVSFVANLAAFLGFVTKMPGAKLERQLKELLIIEKRAKLEQDGVDFKKYI